jgi:hypothetical protein
MSPVDLLNKLVARRRLPASRAKDVKTALYKLADAYETEVTALDLARIESTYVDVLRAYFAGLVPQASASTQRNTVQNLKQFYRLAHEGRLLAHKIPPTTRRMGHRQARVDAAKTSPYRSHTSAQLTSYILPLDAWPPAIQEAWERYRTSRTFDVRPVTLQTQQEAMAAYISYGLTIDRQPLASWDELFDATRLLRFITWHAKRIGAKRISPRGLSVAQIVATIARCEERLEFTAIKALVRKLPAVQPMHNKQSPQHTITARELEDLGLTLLAEARRPLPNGSTPHVINRGLLRAGQHQTALLIRFMWRLPLRSRSVREMQLQTNLYQDQDGRWFLRYVGDQLKVGERNGRVNTFHVPWPDELTSHLEEYLHVFRPIFPNAATDPHVFLTTKGRPFRSQTLCARLATEIYMRLQKRFYPHLLRTLWVDQYLLASNGDVSTAAYLLNDTVATVLKRYHELRGADHVQKAYQFNRQILGNSQTP